MKKGFSLVELSIVLVILGLLVGGILAGQSLIRASELRAVTAEQQRWATATNAFRDKYFALPGDMGNAQSFWGTASTGCDSNAGLSSTGTCNGNADGAVNWCVGATSYACKEVYWYWQHLAFAGLIEGQYLGYGVGCPTCGVPGRSMPRSKLANGYWSVDNLNRTGIGDNFWYSTNYGNFLYLNNGTLSPEDAWNIDTKMDDGMPGRGKVLGVANGGASGIAWGSPKCTTASNSFDFNGSYALSYTDKLCTVAFIQQF